ncbi:hypothetical protein BCEP4_1170029 [Burkholderia cepacia]|nr:hypothetical protein BCEP4_1170029 [Burkholderia cepacia]
MSGGGRSDAHATSFAAQQHSQYRTRPHNGPRLVRPPVDLYPEPACVPTDRTLRPRPSRHRRRPPHLLGALRQPRRQARRVPARRPRRRLQRRPSPPVRSGALRHPAVRPARLRALDAACEPR